VGFEGGPPTTSASIPLTAKFRPSKQLINAAHSVSGQGCVVPSTC
jgi:hypothetical protein